MPGPIREPNFILLGAGGRRVMEMHLQDIRAEIEPVRIGVEKVEMPRLIDQRWWTYRMATFAGDEQKSGIFLHDLVGEGRRPAVLPGEPTGKAELGVQFRQMVTDLFQDDFLIGRALHRHAVRLTGHALKARSIFRRCSLNGNEAAHRVRRLPYCRPQDLSSFRSGGACSRRESFCAGAGPWAWLRRIRPVRCTRARARGSS